MQSLRTTPALVAVGLFVVLLAAGIVWWSQAWTRKAAADSAVHACLADLARRDPQRDARADLTRGEDRFYFVTHDGVALRMTADGVIAATGECREGGDFADTRPYPFDPRPAGGDPAPACCNRDPAPDACGKAQAAYIRAYNAEIARRNPRSIAKYCKSSQARP
ncbi:hypothetical protein [Novosphingobium album (ex Liu et al. 2023)]|uniref:Histidine kinase n=1 Tax=Novosphingobium album (ex Liu et al. 2023) TaxID=3031130 RepID=A0ABT5WSP4_9SPHN|nr:hypothetical protein [Novosphingobium album (ex Liu et al. 2023)]MDE8653064.1 hypothetical protein [Novosphingobium album (ex Liu et al. 2023)]